MSTKKGEAKPRGQTELDVIHALVMNYPKPLTAKELQNEVTKIQNERKKEV